MLIERIFTDDAPLRTISSDQLGRRSFIEALANALLLPPKGQCRVVSLEGSWGEGKTSAIEMAMDLIGQRDADLRPFVVRVNPWQLGTRDALVRALLLELSKIVRGEGKKQKIKKFGQLADELIKYSSALSALKLEPHGFLYYIAARTAFWVIAKFVSNDLDLQRQKEKVSEAVRNAGRPIIVVVDDLDRLLPGEMVEVVRFVRAVGDFERTTYLLAFDHARVVEALGQAGVPSPERFLEKIVQLRMHLPPASPEAIRAILDARLEQSEVYKHRRVFDGSNSRRVELYSFYLAPLINDVRTLLRILARTETTPLGVVREVEYWEVFALNTVAVISPSVFEVIRASATSFTNPEGFPKAAGESRSEELARNIDDTLRAATPRQARYIKGLLRSLFPLLSKVSNRSQSWMNHNGRVAAERPLLTYLLSGVSEGVLPLDTIRAIVTEKAFRAERVKAASQQEEQYLSLLRTIRDEMSLSKLLVADPLDLADILLEVASELPKPEDELGFGIQDRASAMLPLFTELLIRHDRSEMGLAQLLVRDYDGLLSALLLDELHSAGNEATQQLRAKISDEAITQFSTNFVNRIKASITQRQATGPQLGVMLFSLKRFDRSQFDSLVAELIFKDSHSRRAILRGLANSIVSSEHGWVALWKSDLVDEDLAAELAKEAQWVLSDPTADKPLVAAAKSLLEGREIVVSTGEGREVRPAG